MSFLLTLFGQQYIPDKAWLISSINSCNFNLNVHFPLELHFLRSNSSKWLWYEYRNKDIVTNILTKWLQESSLPFFCTSHTMQLLNFSLKHFYCIIRAKDIWDRRSINNSWCEFSYLFLNSIKICSSIHANERNEKFVKYDSLECRFVWKINFAFHWFTGGNWTLPKVCSVGNASKNWPVMKCQNCVLSLEILLPFILLSFCLTKCDWVKFRNNTANQFTEQTLLMKSGQHAN